MIEYPKIDSVYKRDDHGRFIAEYARPEFEYLKDLDWLWTEKIDGTNVRVGWDGTAVQFGGRTDNAQIPTFLLEMLTTTFTPLKLHEAFPPNPEEGPPDVTLFGEGYGPKIQKGGGDYRDTTGFILFDVLVGRWWLKFLDIADIAIQLGVPNVPVLSCGPLSAAEAYVRAGFYSVTAIRERPAEGLVLRPKVDLWGRDGKRVITKLKTKDWRK